MIITLQTYEIANRLLQDSSNCWTRSGALAMAKWLESYEEDTGETLEFDAVAIRCDWTEYPSSVEAHNDRTRGHDLSEDEEDTALERMREIGEVIVFNGGVIVSN